MTTTPGARQSNKAHETSALDKFFQTVEEQTDDAMHRRLIQAAKRKDPAGALEAELGRIVQEILDEA